MSTKTKTNKECTYNTLSKKVSPKNFNRYLLPHLKEPKRGPKPKLSLYKIFNSILYVLHRGIQWNQLKTRRNELHWSNVYTWHHRWSKDSWYEALFEASIINLRDSGQLDLSLLHGEGSNTVVKKGGAGIGYSGHKHQKGEKELTLTENQGFVLGPIAVRPVNVHDSVILPDTLAHLVAFTHRLGLELEGSTLTLDAGFDSAGNKAVIKGPGLIPMIYPNRRHTKEPIAVVCLFRWFNRQA